MYFRKREIENWKEEWNTDSEVLSEGSESADQLKQNPGRAMSRQVG